MRIPSTAGDRSFGFNMTPMIDVVFLLIIFFLVSSHLAQQEVHMQLPLPVAESGQRPTESESARLTVNVLSDGALVLGGRHVSPDELRQQLAEKAAETGETLEVRVRGDRQATYDVVEPVLLACARAGIWNVTFAVYRREEAR